MTWKEIKLATLQKMFSAEGSTIPTDETTADYIAAMPYAANEGMQMLSTAGKYLVKRMEIANNPQENLLGDSVGREIHAVVSGEESFSADNARSFYYEVTGKGKATITCGEFVKEIEFDSMQKYTPFKGVIENVDNGKATILFVSDYPYAVKNIAMYRALYELDELVPDYTKRVRFNLRDITPDFYTINEVFYEGENEQYIKTDDVVLEGDKVIAIDRKVSGNYIIYYNAFPEVITEATEDEYELPLDREVVALLPLYMASQLYKDDDISIATSYRNEFEVAFDRLRGSTGESKAESIKSESGWI